MSRNKDSMRLGLLPIAAITAVIGFICFIIMAYKGIDIQRGKEDIQEIEYKNINELLESNHFSLNIPRYVKNYKKDKLNITYTDNGYTKEILIYSNEFVFKASPYIADDADVLNLYDNKAVIDNEYSTEEKSNILYYRFRQQCKDYENCTVLNWTTSNTMYGLIIDKKIDNDKAKDIVEIDNNTKLKPIIRNKTKKNFDEDSVFKRVTLKSDKYTISAIMPILSSNYTLEDLDNILIITYGKRNILAITDNKKEVDKLKLKYKNIDNKHYAVMYGLDNIDSNDEYANDYDTILKNLDVICDTISIIKN